MIQIGTALVSEDLIEKEFVCNLSACKGACCVAGDFGAPLEVEEAKALESLLPKIKPYLRKEGIEALEKQGAYVTGEDGELETPLVDQKECAYLTFDEHQKGVCGIETAYLDGAINYQKPVSCHLYPVRVTKYTSFEAVNYHRWEICDDACTLGKELKVPVYQFVKTALIRKFGEAWYTELEQAAALWSAEKRSV
ncbi:MAG: DUF3109 family protein [Bacteroidetes bacterium]|jgi:hypothetical protein|nr:DUF3109 family protein [Bacteroidota bacterium]